MKRTCANCHCYDNCVKLNEFCRVMVFQVRRVQFELIDIMASKCEKFFWRRNVKTRKSSQDTSLF